MKNELLSATRFLPALLVLAAPSAMAASPPLQRAHADERQ
jgi:hypothetical protein